MDTMSQELKDYMDTFKEKSTKISVDDSIEYMQRMTKTIETMVLGIDYMDKWTRTSKEFKVATQLHLEAWKPYNDDSGLAKLYKEFYKRTCDPNDYANKMVQELVNERTENG